MKSIKNKKLFLILVLFSSFGAYAQNGMYLDDKHNFLIPLLDKSEMKGHAYFQLLDQINKDSNSYVLSVYDEYLRDVGEKKVSIENKYKFISAVYNGSDIVAKFEKAKERDAIRYIVFNQKAEQVFDTIISVKLGAIVADPEWNFNPTPVHAITNQGVLNYCRVKSNKSEETALHFLSNDFKFWSYSLPKYDNCRVSFLGADNKILAHALYSTRKGKAPSKTNTYIEIISTAGALINKVDLYENDSISIFPIQMEIGNGEVEVISQFTKQSHKYSRIKYGTCVHRIGLNGQIISKHFNELTSTLMNDSLSKKFKLINYSYLYMHKALSLKNGNWLVAAEQLQRTKLLIKPFPKRKIIFNKRAICLMEFDDKAELVSMHVEPNKGDGAKVPKKYYRTPYEGAIYMNANNQLDIDYFVTERGSNSNERVSFVFTDGNAETKKLSLGNLLYDNGKVTSDRYTIPSNSVFSRVWILPARFGHAMIFKYSPYTGFDFDNIKFNN